MARKLTDDEVRSASKLVDKLRRDDYYKGKEAAEELKARMVMCGNTDFDSIWIFREYTGFNWDL